MMLKSELENKAKRRRRSTDKSRKSADKTTLYEVDGAGWVTRLVSKKPGARFVSMPDKHVRYIEPR